MKLLITGGCGFLGSNLASDALARGDELVVLDNLYRNGSRENQTWLQTQGKFTFEHGDLRNQNDPTRDIQEFKPDAIIHLAGQVAMTTSIAHPRMDFGVNVMGTHNLLEAVGKHTNNAKVLYSSTNKVYGELEQYTNFETNNRYQCVEHAKGFNEQTQLRFHHLSAAPTAQQTNTCWTTRASLASRLSHSAIRQCMAAVNLLRTIKARRVGSAKKRSKTAMACSMSQSPFLAWASRCAKCSMETT